MLRFTEYHHIRRSRRPIEEEIRTKEDLFNILWGRVASDRSWKRWGLVGCTDHWKVRISRIGGDVKFHRR